MSDFVTRPCVYFKFGLMTACETSRSMCPIHFHFAFLNKCVFFQFLFNYHGKIVLYNSADETSLFPTAVPYSDRFVTYMLPDNEAAVNTIALCIAK